MSQERPVTMSPVFAMPYSQAAEVVYDAIYRPTDVVGFIVPKKPIWAMPRWISASQIAATLHRANKEARQ